MRNPIFLICILCFAIRLVFCYSVFPVFGLPFIESEDIDNFGSIAVNMIHGHGFVFKPGLSPTLFREPLYPLFLAAIYSVFGENLLAVQFMQTLLGTLTCLVIYLIAKEIFEKKTAILSAFIFTLYPLFIWYTARIWVETLFTFLLSILVLVLVKFLKSPSILKASALGFILGVINLCKSNLLLFPIVLLFALLVSSRYKKKETLLSFCSMFVFMSLVIAPWTYRNYAVSGHFIPVQIFGVDVIAGDINVERNIGFKDYTMPTLGEAEKIYKEIVLSVESKTGRKLDLVEREAAIWNYLLHKYLSSPAFFFRKVATEFVQLWYLGGDKLRCLLFASMQLTLLIPSLFGIIYAARRNQFILPLMLIISYFVIVYSISVGVARYSLPIMPYVGIFAAYWMGMKMRF